MRLELSFAVFSSVIDWMLSMKACATNMTVKKATESAAGSPSV